MSLRKVSVAFFSAQQYDKTYFDVAVSGKSIEIEYFDFPLNAKTAPLVPSCDAVCVFVNDDLNRKVIQALANQGVRLVALRCAGFNNVDLQTCAEFGLSVVRVPDYSPHSVAEHTFALILALNRKTHKAFNRVREGNFELNGLLGFDLFEKSIGVVGCGKIGVCVARIAHGFGMKVLIYDIEPRSEAESYGHYVDLRQLLRESDIVSLHCPLNDQNYHMIDESTLAQMKPNAMLVNTSRGGLVDTASVIKRLKAQLLGGLAIDVYEEEADIFFHDRSSTVLCDDVFARLLTFPNVLITGHQAFFTDEALAQIANTTVSSILAFENGEPLRYQVQTMTTAANERSLSSS